MLIEKITIPNKLGLHTRAAAKLVAVASKFESKIHLKRNDQDANCKSIMAIILLGATKGMALELHIEGGDELEAREALFELIHNKFGEAD